MITPMRQEVRGRDLAGEVGERAVRGHLAGAGGREGG